MTNLYLSFCAVFALQSQRMNGLRCLTTKYLSSGGEVMVSVLPSTLRKALP